MLKVKRSEDINFYERGTSRNRGRAPLRIKNSNFLNSKIASVILKFIQDLVYSRFQIKFGMTRRPFGMTGDSLLSSPPRNGVRGKLLRGSRARFHVPRYTSYVTLLIVASCYLLLNSVNAQQIGLSITPPHLEVVVKPGKSILIAYTIQNFGDPTTLKTNIFSFNPKGNKGEIEIKDDLEGPVRFSLDNSNISFNQPYFLNSKDKQQLLLRIRIPEGAPEGDYYHTFITETVPNPAIEGLSSSRAKGKIGSNILITVTNSGRIDVKGKIAIFDVFSRYKLDFFGKKYRIFDSGDIIPVLLIAENKGKNLIKPNGDIVLRGNFGEKAIYNIVSQNILSENQRQLSASPSAVINCDQGRKSFYCGKSASLLISGFFLGKYDLSTTLSFGEGAPNIYSTVEFIAIPLKFLIGLVTIVLISLFVIKAQKTKNQE